MAKRSTSKAPPNPERLSFEQAVEELEAIIERIEQGEIGLEESLQQRKRGESLIRRCRSILDDAEQELEQVTAEDVPPETPNSPTRPASDEMKPDAG